jgi:hypothetical protein
MHNNNIVFILPKFGEKSKVVERKKFVHGPSNFVFKIQFNYEMNFFFVCMCALKMTFQVIENVNESNNT